MEQAVNKLNDLKIKVAKYLKGIGVTANFLTISGVVLAGLSGYLIYLGEFFWGGLVLFLSGILDTLDGAVGRMQEKQHYFGGILDSVLDRFGDAFVLGGIVFFCIAEGYEFYALLAFLALAGSFAVSYVRARAECEIDSCRVGFWERGERVVFLAAALVLNNLVIAIWILAVGTLMTSFFRLFYAKKPDVSLYQKTPLLRALFHTTGRRVPDYYVKIGLLVAALILVKIPF